jgi:hypothetical protein
MTLASLFGLYYGCVRLCCLPGALGHGGRFVLPTAQIPSRRLGGF